MKSCMINWVLGPFAVTMPAYKSEIHVIQWSKRKGGSSPPLTLENLLSTYQVKGGTNPPLDLIKFLLYWSWNGSSLLELVRFFIFYYSLCQIPQAGYSVNRFHKHNPLERV